MYASRPTLAISVAYFAARGVGAGFYAELCGPEEDFPGCYAVLAGGHFPGRGVGRRLASPLSSPHSQTRLATLRLRVFGALHITLS